MIKSIILVFLFVLFHLEKTNAFVLTAPAHRLDGPVKRLKLQASLIAGINKYSHDSSLCIIDEKKGRDRVCSV